MRTKQDALPVPSPILSTSFQPSPPCCSPPSKPPAHRPQDADPGSPVSRLEGEEGALGRETSPSVTSSTWTGPGELLQGAARTRARTRRTHRAIPRFAPSWQPPSRNRCQAAKATCSWGRARATLSAAEEKPRKTKMEAASGADSSLGEAGQARGCHLRGPSPGLGMANLLPAPSRALYWADTFALLVQQVCLQNSGGHSFWVGAPGWPWASWSLNTGTGLNLTSSHLPADKWIERSSNSNSSKNSYLLLPWSRCLTSVISFNLHRNPML